MHNKITVFFMLLLFVCLFLLVGCSQNTVEVEQRSNQSSKPIRTQNPQETPPVSSAPSELPMQPTAAPPQDLSNTEEHNAEYYIEEDKIYMKSAAEVTVIYDPADYYEPDTSSAINTLLIDDEALFFKEWNSGKNIDEGFSHHSIIRLDKGGVNRQVLASKTSPFGYHDLISFQNRLIYLDECGDSVWIRDINKDGSDQDKLDFDAYSARYDAYPGFGHVDFYKDNEYLYADLILYCKDWSSPTHTVRIDKDCNIERILPKQDEYYIGGSKIYKNAAHTDEKVMIYDASLYYDKDDSCIMNLQVTEEALYFMEEGFDASFNDTFSSIIQASTDGSNRQVMHTTCFNTIYQPVFYHNKVFFVEDQFLFYRDDIGCLDGDGNIRYLLLDEYAKQHDLFDVDNISVRLSIEDDDLIATINFCYSGNKEDVTHILKINEDLSFE